MLLAKSSSLKLNGEHIDASPPRANRIELLANIILIGGVWAAQHPDAPALGTLTDC